MKFLGLNLLTTILLQSQSSLRKFSVMLLISMGLCISPAMANSVSSSQQHQADNYIPTKNFEQKIRFLTAAELAKAEKSTIQYIVPLEQDAAKVYRNLGMTFEFATIKGQLTGLIDGKNLKSIPVKRHDYIKLSLANDLSSKYSIAPLNMPGLDINTFGQSVEFARLSTLATYGCPKKKDSSCQLRYAGAKFVDGNSWSSITLVYASAKVEMKGKLTLGGMKHDFDLLLPGKGWHWIKLIEKGDTYYISYATPESLDPIIIAL